MGCFEEYAKIPRGGITVKKRILILSIALFSAIYFASGVNLLGDLDCFVFDATPSNSVSMYGGQLDFLMDSPGNVRMGFGVQYHLVTADASFLGEDFKGELGLYSVGEYRSDLTSVLDFLVITRGGISIPNFDFSKLGYFTEVSISVGYEMMKKWLLLVGLSMKSHAFTDSYASFIAVKLGVGGDL
jgi:hypothetical protein